MNSDALAWRCKTAPGGQPYRHLRLELDTLAPSFNENAVSLVEYRYRGAIAFVVECTTIKKRPGSEEALWTHYNCCEMTTVK
jgi:hypothetical protein